MSLTSQQFEQMTSHLRSERKGGPDKRRDVRAGVRVRLEVTPVLDGVAGRSIVVFTRDLSKSGMAFLCDDRLNNGVQLLWDLPDADGGPPRRWAGVVRACRRTAGDQWTIGVEFLATIPSFVTEASPSTPARDQKTPRRTVSSAGKESAGAKSRQAVAAAPAPRPKGNPADLERLRRAILD